MKISAPRKGTELSPRVFSAWQDQVIRAIRLIGFRRASMAKRTIDFGSIAAGGQETIDVTVPGVDNANAVVVVSTAGLPPAGLVYDGNVNASLDVRIRATNITTSAIDPPSASFLIAVFNI